MKHHEKLNYVELPAIDLGSTKAFFQQVFGWEFVDFGPDYTSFNNQGLDGGFFKSDLASSCSRGSALLVFYSTDLELTLQNVIEAKGKIIKPIFAFPGGRRFHFSEPSGNEFAVWSE